MTVREKKKHSDIEIKKFTFVNLENGDDSSVTSLSKPKSSRVRAKSIWLGSCLVRLGSTPFFKKSEKVDFSRDGPPLKSSRLDFGSFWLVQSLTYSSTFELYLILILQHLKSSHVRYTIDFTFPQIRFGADQHYRRFLRTGWEKL